MPRRDSVTQALVEQHLRELQKLTDELFKGLFQGHVTSGVTISNPALIARKLVETDRQLQISVANREPPSHRILELHLHIIRCRAFQS